MGENSRDFDVEPSAVRLHVAECEVWAEFRRVYRARAHWEWRKYQRDIAEMIVINLPSYYLPARGVG